MISLKKNFYISKWVASNILEVKNPKTSEIQWYLISKQIEHLKNTYKS